MIPTNRITMRLCRTWIHLSLLVVLVSAAQADDWPQWMGPTRNGIWAEKGIVESFPAQGPPIRWRAEVACGYSGPTVANGKVFVTDYVTDGDTTGYNGQRDKLTGTERLLCFDAKTGKKLWEHAYEEKYYMSYPDGPRAAPTVDGELVYSLGAEGKLFCLKVADGNVVWQKNFKKDYRAKTPFWGFAHHPLVDGPRLICVAGGKGSTVVAFDKATGEELWKSLNARQGYSPPTMIQVGERRELIFWEPRHVHSLDPISGTRNWSVPFTTDYDMSIMAPRQSGYLLFVGGHVGKGMVLELAAEKAEKAAAEILYEVNPTTAISPINSTPIIDGDHMYGVDREGQLRAVVLRTGERLWETFAATTGDRRENSGTAFLVKNGDRYFLFSEQGDLIIAKLTPESYQEISRAHILEPTSKAFGRSVVWSHPAFADKCMFARNDKELVCVELAK